MTNLSLKRYAAWHEQAIAPMKDRVVNRTSSSILRI